jgi:hypothetical protein
VTAGRPSCRTPAAPDDEAGDGDQADDTDHTDDGQADHTDDGQADRAPASSAREHFTPAATIDATGARDVTAELQRSSQGAAPRRSPSGRAVPHRGTPSMRNRTTSPSTATAPLLRDQELTAMGHPRPQPDFQNMSNLLIENMTSTAHPGGH